MDEFLNYLIKKSDLENNDYFAYKQPSQTSRAVKHEEKMYGYTKIDAPTAESYVVLDFETTGLNCRANKIIEIGAVKVINGEINGTFSTLIDPQQYIPAYITQKVHISNDMVKGKPKIEEMLPHFMVFLADLPIVAHNASFDMGFLLENANALGIEINNPVIDTLSLSRKINRDCQKHNLGYLTDYFGINLKNAHRAYYDAYATHQLYQIIRKRYLNIKI